MTIDKYLNKQFRLGGRRYRLDRVHDHVSGASGYIILDNHDDHLANIDQLTDEGFSWFTFILNVESKGFIKYSDIERNLVIN